MEKKVFNKKIGSKNLVVETGELAKQANGSVLVRYEDSVILSAATISKNAKDLDFFPLTVLYEEKLYSVGKIPGGFLKREGRPSEHATLISRLIDRPIRPMFEDGFRNEVQSVNTVLSVDKETSPEMAAMFGASLSIGISEIPFDGPIAGVYVGRVNGEFIINPSVSEMEKSDIELALAGTKDAVNMVEAGANEVSEEEMIEAILFGHKYIKELVDFQEEIIKEVGKDKINIEVFKVDDSIQNEVVNFAKDKLVEAIGLEKKIERYSAIDSVKEETIEFFEKKEYNSENEKNKTLKMVKSTLAKIEKDEFRKMILNKNIRSDGRKLDEIRPLNSQIDILPRAHGSGLFTRGETQVLSALTLGAQGDEQLIDNLSDDEKKRFMHHYNFPPYCVGETGRMGGPGRREIGHGALGERALSKVIPSEEKFPYTIRLVSEVLESNGSSSQASICASSLSLMAGGVPISSPVSGIAMGLISDEENYAILSDIQGLEDHLGDMDFKVAGTSKGICALQMDIKIKGITSEILKKAMAQAKLGREKIMQDMLKTIEKPRKEVSEYAPKLEKINVRADQIRDVIGPGGKIINEIIEKCDNIDIDISQTGLIKIFHRNQKMIDKAKDMILKITKEAKVGEIYEGKAVRIENYGVFVELFEGTDGMVHVSKMADKRVEHPRDLVKIAQKIKVKVIGIDDKGRVQLSMKDVKEED